MTPTFTLPTPERPRVTLLAVVESLHEFARTSEAKSDYYASDLSRVVSDAIFQAHMKQARRALGPRKDRFALPVTNAGDT